MLSRFRRSKWLPIGAMLFVAAGFLIAAPTGKTCKISAAPMQDYGQFPVDYCYQVAISATNTSGSPVTNATVRVPINALGFRTTTMMDDQFWDLYPYLSVFSQEVDMLAQDATSTSAFWWLQFPELDAGETLTETMLFGLATNQRDQGVLFTGDDDVASAHNAAFNIADDLQLDVRLELLDADVQTAVLASHWNANTGYKVSLANVAGLAIQAQVDNQACTVAWDSAWTGENIQVTVFFNAPTLTVQVDDTVEAQCNTGLGSISSVTTPVAIGDALTDGIIRDVKIQNTSGVVAHWGFNPVLMNETGSVNPYTGTVQDESGNGRIATYSFDRSQADLQVSVGPVELVSAGPLFPPATVVPDLLNKPDIFGGFGIQPTAEPDESIFKAVFSPAAEASGFATLWYAVIFWGFTFIFVVIAFFVSKGYIPVVFFISGIPLLYASNQGYLPYWYFAIWALFTITSWFAFRHGESGA